MRTEWLWNLPRLALLALVLNVNTSQAQYGGSPGAPRALPYDAMPAAAFSGGPQGAYPSAPAYFAPENDRSYLAMANAYGGMPAPGQMPGMPGGMAPMMSPYGGHPAAFQQPMPMGEEQYAEGAYGEGDYGGEGYFEEDGYSGGRGRVRRGRNLLDLILPFGEGGLAAPRWYDLYVDAVLLSRDKISHAQSFTSSGINGPRVLGTDNLRFNEEPGFRAGAAIQVGPGGSAEFGYQGTHFFASSSSVNDATNMLYSPFGNFGQTFMFDDVDRAFFHQISYSSSFNSFDLNYRRRWTGRDARMQGSWLAGVRYFQLNEKFTFNTRTTLGPGFMNYVTNTTNSLVGFQVGGDAWVTLIPGLRIGGEAKAGIYGNEANQRTTINANSIAVPVVEDVKRSAPALLAEMNAMVIYRANDHWTIRGGYQFLFVEHVALATDNFNREPPQVFLPAGFVSNRVPSVSDTGNVFMHGLTLGAEFMW